MPTEMNLLHDSCGIKCCTEKWKGMFFVVSTECQMHNELDGMKHLQNALAITVMFADDVGMKGTRDGPSNAKSNVWAHLKVCLIEFNSIELNVFLVERKKLVRLIG